jgi:hypothetical protein
MTVTHCPQLQQIAYKSKLDSLQSSILKCPSVFCPCLSQRTVLKTLFHKDVGVYILPQIMERQQA